MPTAHIVTKHYAGDGGLGDRIYERLRSLGFEERNPLSPKDTAAVDQFHVGGFAYNAWSATAEYPSNCWTFAISTPRAIRRDAKM